MHPLQERRGNRFSSMGRKEGLTRVDASSAHSLRGIFGIARQVASDSDTICTADAAAAAAVVAAASWVNEAAQMLHAVALASGTHVQTMPACPCFAASTQSDRLSSQRSGRRHPVDRIDTPTAEARSSTCGWRATEAASRSLSGRSRKG